jgi:hypothetical protein
MGDLLSGRLLKQSLETHDETYEQAAEKNNRGERKEKSHGHTAERHNAAERNYEWR